MKAIIAFLALFPTLVISDEFSRWTWRVPNPPAQLFTRVIFAQEQFVAVGDLGFIMTSADGRAWQVENSPATNRLYSLIHTDQFVAAGDGGSVVVSSDARKWQLTNVGDSLIWALAHGAGNYVALNSQGHLFQSEDALHWGQLDAPQAKGSRDMVYGGGLFVTVGHNGLIATSTNGVDWVKQNSGTTGLLFSVAYGEGRFVAVGGEGSNGIILTSTDGEFWQLQLVDAALADVTYADGRFLIVGGSPFGSGISLTSEDGLYFDSPPGDQGLDRRMDGVACGNGVCVAVGSGVFVSDDGGLTWTNATVGPREVIARHAKRQGTLVGVGSGGVILTTTNGITFMDQRVREDAGWFGVCAGEPGFVAVGIKGALAFSPDGMTWSDRVGATAGNLWSVAYGNGIYVAVAWEAEGPAHGYFVTSPDGSNWTERRPFSQTYINRVIAFGAGRFVAGGYDGKYFTSTNGLDWSERSTGTSGHLATVEHVNGRFLGFAPGGTLHSDDALEWTFAAGEVPNAGAVAHGNGVYLAVTRNWPDVLWSSPDGVHWQREPIGMRDLSSVVYAYDSFWVGGTVVQSASSLVPQFERKVFLPGQTIFDLFGKIGREYELQSSTNLVDWELEQAYEQTTRLHTVIRPADSNQRFYRVKLKE